MLIQVPELGALVSHLGNYIRSQKVFDAWVEELTVLAVARELDCRYVWGAHRPQGERAGLSAPTIEAVRAGRAPAGLADREALVVRFAHELLRDHRVSDATFDAIATWLGKEGATLLTSTVGHYCHICAVNNAFDVAPAPGADVLPVGG